jgi:[ribosomal protein S18]-alanine N-acetyltransferase
MGLVIRPMTEADIEVVLPIEHASSSQPWTAGMFRDEIRQNDARVYVVAEFGDAVVGFGGLMLAYDEGHITNIAVDPEQRRSGLATRLLLRLTRVAIAKSLKAMTLEVRVSNTAARALYARFGYVPAGIRPRYYADNNEDALIYWAYDIDTADYGLRLASINQRLEAMAGDRS